MDKAIDPICIADVSATLGEGPLWIADRDLLVFTDIPEARLHICSESEGNRRLDVEGPVCALVSRARGGFVGTTYDRFVTVDLDSGAFQTLAMVPGEPSGNRFNDGKVDRAGRFWAGTMDRHEREASGALYRLDPDLSVSRCDTGYRVTNGPAFSPDGRTMYHNDSALQRIYAFTMADDGSLSDRRVLAQFGEGEGYPDGMTVDSEGCLWVAFWDGWCVRRIAPDGSRVAEVRLPVQRPTSCTFGGERFDRLFITSASRDLEPAERAMQPSAGGLFMVQVGVSGLPEPLFAG